LTEPYKSVIILIVNYFLNLYSILVAKRFETLYHSPNSKHNAKALDVLDHYRTVRRLLPIQACGRHLGNHKGSKQKAFKATQGF